MAHFIRNRLRHFMHKMHMGPFPGKSRDEEEEVTCSTRTQKMRQS